MDQESLVRLKQGEKVTIFINGEPEEWSKIICPGFKDSDKDFVKTTVALQTT